MIHKGAVLALGMILLFVFCAIAQADSNPHKDEEIKNPEHVVDGHHKGGGRGRGGPHYSEDQFGRRCCGWGPGRRYCVRWCRNAEEVAAFEAYEEETREGGGTQYSVDQNRRCCQGGRFGGCARWC